MDKYFEEKEVNCIVTRLMKSTIVLCVDECGDLWRDFLVYSGFERKDAAEIRKLLERLTSYL